MARIPTTNRLSLPPELRAWYENTVSLDLNIFKVLMTAPGTMRPMLELGAHLMFDIQLPMRLRELAILATAHAAGTPYPWTHHSEIALDLGFTKEQLTEIAMGSDDLSTFAQDERLTIELARIVVYGREIASHDLETIRSTLSDRNVVELLLVVGFYWTLSRVSTILHVEAEPPQGAALIEATRRIHKTSQNSHYG
jgi:alkylhydroperoxidase family enzyme